MKRLIFALVLIICTQTIYADINISCAQVGDSNEIEVSYAMDGGDANLPRLIALDITADNGATIDEIAYTDPCFWVYLGTIQIVGGDVVDYGNPVAPSADPCALGGLHTSGITIEMGSLYADDDPNHQAPPTGSGVLLSIKLSGDCNVTINENSIRGGVTLEDTTKASTNYTGCTVIPETECFPSGHADYAQWASVGKPTSWCNPRQCYGDADGLMHTEKGLTNYWVGLPDLQILSLGWKKSDTDPNFGTFIAADFDHASHTEKGIAYPYRCGLPDLQTMSSYWKGPNGGLPEPPTDCLDVP